MESMSETALCALVASGRQYAIIDVRDEGAFSRSHLLRASSTPLRRLELDLASQPDLRDRTIVVCDEDGRSEAVVAARRMADWGLRSVSVLAGGLEGWRASGLPIYAGMHTRSKAFGEAVEVALSTPSITPGELARRRDSGQPLCVIDCRPHAEYSRSTLPGSLNVPGFELPYRWSQVVPDPTVPVVVHCAGRTRSIIGAQTLIELGVPNPVVALENGTMGWLRAGFELVRPDRPPSGFDPGFRPTDDVASIAHRIRNPHSIPLVRGEQVASWRRQEPERTTYLVDVRTQAEYEAGHPDGAIHAPGGQLIQSTDRYLMVHNARVVVVDDDGLRASIASAWLKRMGWQDVFVWPILHESMAITVGREPRRFFRASAPAGVRSMSVAGLVGLLDGAGADILDVDSSVEYERAHLPGSIFVERRHLGDVVAARPEGRHVVLVSGDGALAAVCAGDVRDDPRVHVLEGGKSAWIGAGRPVAGGSSTVPPDIDDVWRMPLEARGDRRANIDAYLSWEIALTEQVRADGSDRFVLPGWT
jgi:rhodanese-related sulfurtransferase